MTLCAECAVKLGYKGKPDYERHVCAFCGRAAYELGRNSYGFEIAKPFYRRAKEEMLTGMTGYEPDTAKQLSFFEAI